MGIGLQVSDDESETEAETQESQQQKYSEDEIDNLRREVILCFSIRNHWPPVLDHRLIWCSQREPSTFCYKISLE